MAVHRTNLLHSLADGPPRVLNKLTIPVYPMKPMLPVVTDITGEDIREVGLSRSRHRDRVSISPSMPFPISMLEHRIQGWAMPSG